MSWHAFFIGIIWDAAMVARLRELNALGLNSSRIAEIMGVPRNAVHGARFRHGMTRSKEERAPPRELPLAPAVPGAHECRYILDAGPWKGVQPHWCRKPTIPDSPYCAEHHERCHYRVGTRIL